MLNKYSSPLEKEPEHKGTGRKGRKGKRGTGRAWRGWRAGDRSPWRCEALGESAELPGLAAASPCPSCQLKTLVSL